MSRNRALLIGGVALGIIVVTLGIIGLFSANKTNDQATTASTSTTSTAPILTGSGLVISNFAKDTSITSSSREQSVEAAISSRISSEVTLAGIVRTSSLKVTSSGTTKNIRFIVDIPSIKQSYTALLGEDSETGESSLRILCPTAQELIYPSFSCQDPAA